MRTKTLLLAAVLSAAGVASSLAQVYSVNAVGYVNVTLTSGLNLICNPLKVTAGNDLTHVLPLTDADIGTTVYTYDTSFHSSTFLGSVTGWLPNLTVAPGQGFFINIVAGKTVTFVGEVPQGADSNISVKNGLALISSPVPQSLVLDQMAFPAELGDTVYFFRGSPKAYVNATYLGSPTGWLPAANATPAVGEGFWSSKANAGTWTRNFSVNTP
jgi:uncharacterized membrane protein YeaQ/YmgE (transglycosylase-associated protein family)